jgi:hypothetical protein
MRSPVLPVCLIGLVLGVAAAAWSAADIVDINVTVQPKTLVLNSKGTWVTVHADIAYATVSPETVKLEGVSAAATFADARGDLVAKFPVAAIKALVSPPEASLTLTGVRKDGVCFTGSDAVAVK